MVDKIEIIVPLILIGSVIVALVLPSALAGDNTYFINSGSGSGNATDTTNCNNIGTGRFIHVVGSNCNAKSIVGSGDISVTNTSNTIVIDYNGTIVSDDTVCANVGSGSQVYKDGECNFRTVLGSPDISVTQQTDTITIDFNGTVSGSLVPHTLLNSTAHTDTITNSPSQSSLVYGVNSSKWSELTFPFNKNGSKLYADSGVLSWEYGDTRFVASNQTLSIDDDVVLVSVTSNRNITLPEITGNNDGKIITIHRESGSANLVISGFDTDKISGFDTYTGLLHFREFVTFVIESDATGWRIIAEDDNDTHLQILQLIVQINQLAIKTNIGTSYTDVYVGTFDGEQFNRIYFSNATYFALDYVVDYVGTGTQQCRWVDQTDNSNVLYEDGTFTSDQNPDINGQMLIPSWAINQNVRIEMQCKSTVGTDDPQVYGYRIMIN